MQPLLKYMAERAYADRTRCISGGIKILFVAVHLKKTLSEMDAVVERV